MRKPAGTGVCWPMISFTFFTALTVRVTGGAFLVTSGTVEVAICISLALKLFNYSKCCFPNILLIPDTIGETVILLDAVGPVNVALFPACITHSEQRINSVPGA